MYPSLPVPTDTTPKPPTWQALLAFLATLPLDLPTPSNLTFLEFRAPRVSIQFSRNATRNVDAWLAALRGDRGKVVESYQGSWVYTGEVADVCGFSVEVWAIVDRADR